MNTYIPVWPTNSIPANNMKEAKEKLKEILDKWDGIVPIYEIKDKPGAFPY